MIGPFSRLPSPFTVSGRSALPHESTLEKRGSSYTALYYTSLTHTINLIRLASQGAWLEKADITSAFKFLLIRPDFLCISWRGHLYFAVCLTFRCKSSLKIFDSLSQALCWILLNNHNLPYVVHLLDDFLMVIPPSSPPTQGLTILKSTIHELGVPLSANTGTSTSLNSSASPSTLTLTPIYQATLQTEKLLRTSLFISNYLLVTSR